MVFIVSTGRSGTTTLADLLSALPGYSCLHEPEPILIRESAAYRYGELAGGEITAVLQQTRHPLLDGDIYCESNQTLSLLLPLLQTSFPQARIIWLLRNGLDVVASTMQKQWYSGHSEHLTPYEQSTPTQQAWIDGRIRADKLGLMSAAEWDALPRFEKCCWYWHYVNGVIAADLAAWPVEQQYLLRLETIVQQMPLLLAWLGVAADGVPPMVQRNPAKQPPYHWSRWSEEERAAFGRWCGPLMDAHYPGWRTADGTWRDVGYETPPERNQRRFWANRLKQWVRRWR